MPIRPFLAGQAFEPEVIREMSFALETVYGKLNLALTDDPRYAARRLKDHRTSATWCAGCADPNRNDAQRVQALIVSE
jgi:hypothetical protein